LKAKVRSVAARRLDKRIGRLWFDPCTPRSPREPAAARRLRFEPLTGLAPVRPWCDARPLRATGDRVTLQFDSSELWWRSIPT